MSKKIELGIHGAMCFLKNLTDSRSIAEQMLKQLIKANSQSTDLYKLIKGVSIILDDIENRLSPSLTLGELTTGQVEKPIEQFHDDLPWDRPVNKLILGAVSDHFHLAFVDAENNLLAMGGVELDSLEKLVRFLKVNPENVYIDIGGGYLPKIIEACKRNAYTPVKGTSIGEIRPFHINGVPAFYVDHKKPPFSFLCNK